MPLLEDLPRVEDTVWGRELKEIWWKEGYAEGFKEGYAEGYKEGFKMGCEKALETARQSWNSRTAPLLRDGLLSQEELDSIWQELQSNHQPPNPT